MKQLFIIAGLCMSLLASAQIDKRFPSSISSFSRCTKEVLCTETSGIITGLYRITVLLLSLYFIDCLKAI